jgi:hypothetical protein
MSEAEELRRLAIERIAEQNRAARDERYRTNIEFTIRQARRVAGTVVCLVVAATASPRLVGAIVGAPPTARQLMPERAITAYGSLRPAGTTQHAPSTPTSFAAHVTAMAMSAPPGS